MGNGIPDAPAPTMATDLIRLSLLILILVMIVIPRPFSLKDKTVECSVQLQCIAKATGADERDIRRSLLFKSCHVRHPLTQWHHHHTTAGKKSYL